jgi:hypothetical protein
VGDQGTERLGFGLDLLIFGHGSGLTYNGLHFLTKKTGAGNRYKPLDVFAARAVSA